MADVFRCDAALEKSVAHLVASSDIREADGEIGFAVVGEMQLLALRFCQCGISHVPASNGAMPDA